MLENAHSSKVLLAGCSPFGDHSARKGFVRRLVPRRWACGFERMDVELVLDCFSLTQTGVRLDELAREFGRTRTTSSTCAHCVLFVCNLFERVVCLTLVGLTDVLST